MTQPDEIIDEIIIYMSAWRRLHHNIEETRKEDPEKYDGIANALLRLMDMAYESAAADLKRQKESMEHNLNKIRENSAYGRMGE